MRKDVAIKLKAAATSYYLKKGFSCHEEQGLVSWGKLRADVVCINLKGSIVICEIKSSKQDYLTDSKWRKYIPYCNKMVFVLPEYVYLGLKETLRSTLKPLGVGILVLDPTSGYLKSVLSSKQHGMDEKTKLALIIRLAWRNGCSKRTSRRKRQFLT